MKPRIGHEDAPRQQFNQKTWARGRRWCPVMWPICWQGWWQEASSLLRYQLLWDQFLAQKYQYWQGCRRVCIPGSLSVLWGKAESAASLLGHFCSMVSGFDPRSLASSLLWSCQLFRELPHSLSLNQRKSAAIAYKSLVCLEISIATIPSYWVETKNWKMIRNQNDKKEEKLNNLPKGL